MQHPWHLQAQGALPTKNPASVEHGPHMDNLDGTLGLHLNITGATKSTFPKHKAHEFVIQWSSSQPTAKCQKCPQMMQPSTQQMTLSRHLQSHNHLIHSYQSVMTKWWLYDIWLLFFNMPSPRNPCLIQGCQTLHPHNGHEHAVKQNI